MIGQKGFPAVSGGIEKHVQELSKHLADQDHEILSNVKELERFDLPKT